MDPTLNFQGEWYSTGWIVMSGTVVAIVTSIASWRIFGWLKNRNNRHAHKPLLDDVTKGGEVAGARRSLRSFFAKGRHNSNNLIKEEAEYDDHSETYSLKRSSTVQSKTSLISSGSSRTSVPPMIVQSCQPSDIHIPERRQSSFSVDSGTSGFEIGQYQTEMGSDAEGSIKSRSSIRKKFSNKVDDGQLSDALEEDEEDESNDEKDKEEEEKVGSLLFSLEHDEHRDSLTIHIIKATDLTLTPSSSNKSASQQTPLFDPYIRLLLLPEGKQKAKTRIVRRTRNPIFEETFTFYGMNNQKLFQSFVKFSVISHDKFSKDQMIGHVLLPLTRKVITKDRHVFTLCRALSSANQVTQKPGELFISLNFDPSNDKMTVVVLKARNLPRMDMAGLADPYVKVYFMCDGLRVDKKKTQVKKRTLNPVYNETFLFTMPPHFQQRVPSSSNQPPINQVLLRFVILDWDRMSKNEVMGKVEIGPEAKNQSGADHWRDVMEAPRKQMAVWHRVE